MNRVLVAATGILLLSGCATVEDRIVYDIYWEAGKPCEAQYHTLSMVRVLRDGSLTLVAAADSSSEKAKFVECYWAGIRKLVEQRRQAGQPLPEDFKMEPSVDID
ncbi:MAG TPA: hypothetical protein VHT71_20750 [Methylomirabilota bacterium]|jgi:hypothetical protein|nr:hypothetical protein [Methylomirabilota bacterium]